MTDDNGSSTGARVPPDIAQAAVERLLDSPYFSNSRRLSDYLRLIGRKAIAGETAGIGERLIALEIYGREGDYDSATDSIVRVEANRLRAKLRAYYEAEGATDPVRVRLPQDCFIPVFEDAQASNCAVTLAPKSHRTQLALTIAVTLAAVTTMAALAPFTRRIVGGANSIAVLPFSTSNSTPDKDYICDGLTEQITNQLGRSGKLQVAARHSAQQFKDRAGDVRQIGRQLHVDLVLDGGLRFTGREIEFSAHLYDTHTGHQLWSKAITRPSAEMASLQNAASTELAAALHLDDAAVHRPSHEFTNDAVALDSYLQARYLFNSRKPENLWKSVELYKAALHEDPNFALAYAGLAEGYVVLASNENQDMYAMSALARQAVNHALGLDPRLPEALLTKAATQEDRDFSVLERDYRAALAANPSNAIAHHWWGLNLLAVGRFAEAENEIRQAFLLDPLSLHIGANIGAVFYCSRRYQDTIDQERKILDLDPHLLMARLLTARGYEGLGQYKQAEQILLNIPKSETSAGVLADLGHVYAASGNRARAFRAMEDLTRMAKTRHVSPYHLAFIQAGLGNRSEAMALLELHFEQHDAPLAYLRVDPRWDPLRGDPRFERIVHALSLDK